jgi:serine/threonine protein kinase
MEEAAKKLRATSIPNLDGYDIGKELARGGMGVVYHAVRKTDQKAVVVKVKLPAVAVSEQARSFFLREIASQRSLQHRNIVALLDHGSAGSTFYFVMEYCGGGNLDELRRRYGSKLRPGAVAPILTGCLHGLGHAHRLGFVHRDLKPANILLHRQAERLIPRLADFGLAKRFEDAGFSGMTATGSRGGTLAYMPREQLQDYKRAQPVSDLWSLAATFYELFTGATPLNFGGRRDPLEVILHDDPVPIRQRDPKFPKNLAKVMDRALSTDPSKRFQSAAEMEQAIKAAVI